MKKKETAKEYRKRVMESSMEDLTKQEAAVGVQFALDDAVKKGMLKKRWNDRKGEMEYVDARVGFRKEKREVK